MGDVLTDVQIVGAEGRIVQSDLTDPLTHDQQITFAVILAAVTFLIIYDALIAWKKGSGATESWTITKLSANWPFIPFLFGVLIGHLFTSQHDLPSLTDR